MPVLTTQAGLQLERSPLSSVPYPQLTHYVGQPVDVAKMVLAVMTNSAITNAVTDVDGGERLGTWSDFNP